MDSRVPTDSEGHSSLRITQAGVSVAGLARLRREFAETGIAWLPAFISPPILASLLKLIESARFLEKDEISGTGRVFGTTLKAAPDDPALSTLHFMLNQAVLFDAVQRISGSAPLRSLMGRLHRTYPGNAQHIDWHDDEADFRTVGISMNLSSESFGGGAFQMREYGVFKSEISQTEPGDAFLFRIGSGWQHRLAPVESGVRTAGVGWFRTQPDWSLRRASGFPAGAISLAAESLIER